MVLLGRALLLCCFVYTCGVAGMVKLAVTALSDDEAVSPPQDLQVVPAAPAQPAGVPKKRKLDLDSPGAKASAVAELRGKLGKLSNALCACARASASRQSCFKQFHGAGMDAVVKVLSRQPDAVTKSRKGHILLGKFVCQNACRRLLQIGSGRYTRLRKCAQSGQAAPLDGRRVRKKMICKHTDSVRKRALITEYLTELYHQVSEPMPEANRALQKLKDEAMAAGSLQVCPTEGEIQNDNKTARKSLCFRRNRGRRPKLAGQVHRGKDQSQMRLLPPGTYTDYLTMLRARHPEMKLTLKLFVKAPS
eukprot:s3758_g15.t1